MDYNEIESDVNKMIKDIENSNLNTLEIEFPNGLKIKMDKGNTKTIQSSMPVVAQNISPVTVGKVEKVEETKEKYKEIKSPMVGTFYSSSSPKAEPFVKVGERVRKGQVVCIVEAMKLMNEIEAEFDGEIVEVCKKDEDMVEYGEVLFKIK